MLLYKWWHGNRLSRKRLSVGGLSERCLTKSFDFDFDFISGHRVNIVYIVSEDSLY